ncbi:MAG: hypothetical protein WBD27_17875 [Pyrinomonadaceae bacterium]
MAFEFAGSLDMRGFVTRLSIIACGAARVPFCRPFGLRVWSRSRAIQARRAMCRWAGVRSGKYFLFRARAGRTGAFFTPEGVTHT